MPQKEQTDEEQYKTLLENLEAVKDLPKGRGDNLKSDESDDEVLDKIYPPEKTPPTGTIEAMVSAIDRMKE